MKRLMPVILVLTITIFIPSCAKKNYREAMKGPEQKFYKGQYKDAARMLLSEVNRESKDQLLYMMECGYMLHVAGDYETSNKVLLKAAKIAQVKPISVSKQAAALMTNQTATNYRGEDFEKVLIHMYLGINFLMLKKYDEARVEFKSVNNELSKIKSENGQARYKQNVMAKYLTAIAYELIADTEKDEEDLEFAFIEYKQIQKLMPKLEMVKSDIQRLDKKLDSINKWNHKFGELILIFQSGRGAIKVSRGKLFSDPSMKRSIRISISAMSLKAGVTAGAIMITMNNAENPIPRFIKRSNKTKFVRMKITNKNLHTTRLENIEQTAIKNLKDDYSRLKAKVAASIVVKAAASIATGLIVKKATKKSGIGALLGAIAGAATGAALFSQIKPDLRCWHSLPANLQLGRVFLKPGKYSVTLEFVGFNGAIQKSKKIDVEIIKGGKTFINERTLL